MADELDLEVLLKEEDRFEPPPDFAEQANCSDPAGYEAGRQE